MSCQTLAIKIITQPTAHPMASPHSLLAVAGILLATFLPCSALASPSITSLHATLSSPTGVNLTVTVGDATKAIGNHADIAGSNVTFHVAATGSGTLSYQWQQNGSPVSGATEASLPLSNIQPANAGSYVVVVTDSTGSTTSQVSTLTTQPASQFAAPGTSVTFHFGPLGEAPFTYQWKLNGTAIDGATDATYTLASVTTSNPGGYSVTATDAEGAATSSWLAVLTVLPTIPAATATVEGTVGTDCSTAITSAITAVKTSGGTVIFPGPGIYYSQAFTLPSNVRLQVNSGATLMALPYTASGGLPAYVGTTDLITVASGSTNVEITGGGIIDGNGGSGWWGTAPNYSNPVSTRPRLIRFSGSSSKPINNCSVHDITLQNSMSFHIISAYTNNITFNNVTIIAPSNSPNTDAIDPAGNNMLFYNCHISNGDDCIAVKADGTPCSNIAVSNCAFGTGHGLSVGGQTNSGLNGMVVTNCTFNGTTSGLRLKADPTQGGLVQNLTYANITMTGVQYPIVFYSYYGGNANIGNPGDGRAETDAAVFNANPPNTLPGVAPPFWKNILLSDLNTTGTTGAHNVIWGLPLASTTPDGYFSNVVLNNVSLDKNLDIIDAYDVQFTGSTSLSLFTYNALVITSQPLSTAVNSGAGTSFTVATAGTSGAATVQSPAIQWYFNGTALADGTQADGTTVAGATTSTLTLGNVQPGDAGSYAAKASNSLDSYGGSLVVHNYAVSSTSQPAQLTVNLSFSDWAAQWSLTGLQAGPAANPAGDGIVNLVKFALGLNPTVCASKGLPTLTQESGQYVFRFTRPLLLCGITYTVQTSTDLVNWTGTIATTVESSTRTTETLVATLPATGPRLFVRLQVTQP